MAIGARREPAELLHRPWLLRWLAPPRGEYARASQICFLVPLPPTSELSSLPTQLLYKSKGNILPILCVWFFFSFPEQIGCHYVQLSSLRSGGGWGDTTGGEMGGRDGFRKTAYSPSEGESSLQLRGSSTSHTDLRGKPREL